MFVENIIEQIGRPPADSLDIMHLYLLERVGDAASNLLTGIWNLDGTTELVNEMGRSLAVLKVNTVYLM